VAAHRACVLFKYFGPDLELHISGQPTSELSSPATEAAAQPTELTHSTFVFTRVNIGAMKTGALSAAALLVVLLAGTLAAFLLQALARGRVRGL
jgi:hypothetical protein